MTLEGIYAYGKSIRGWMRAQEHAEHENWIPTSLSNYDNVINWWPSKPHRFLWCENVERFRQPIRMRTENINNIPNNCRTRAIFTKSSDINTRTTMLPIPKCQLIFIDWNLSWKTILLQCCKIFPLNWCSFFQIFIGRNGTEAVLVERTIINWIQQICFR